ncbi:MAG TPA: hypothetical protein VJR05_12675 [Acidimicrobiia bacterium]|nr:hypothetical protein [Acidimicrobiia bacterium]
MLLRLGGLDPSEVMGKVGLTHLDRVAVRPAPGWLVRLWGQRASAMTVPWAVYLSPLLLGGDPKRLGGLIVHELVHLRQWRQLGIARFLWRYLGDYWRGRRTGLSHREAYLAISLEEEARQVSGH